MVPKTHGSGLRCAAAKATVDTVSETISPTSRSGEAGADVLHDPAAEQILLAGRLERRQEHHDDQQDQPVRPAGPTPAAAPPGSPVPV